MRSMLAAYRGVFPVQDDLRNVVCRMQEVVIPPLVPVNCHGAIFIHAGDMKEHGGCEQLETWRQKVHAPHASLTLSNSNICSGGVEFKGILLLQDALLQHSATSESPVCSSIPTNFWQRDVLW